MKKNKYIVIDNPLDDYDFSFFRCHAAEIGAYGIGIIIFILVCTLLVLGAENKKGGMLFVKTFLFLLYVPFH